MANLSNINNKFIVSDAGHVSIGATTTTYPLTVESGGVGTVLRAGTAFVSIDSVGTAASPSLIFNGDDNTGIFRAAADTLAFSTAGTERIRIDSAGLVSIKNTGVPTLRLENTDTSLAVQTLGSIEYYQNDPSSPGAGAVARINSVNESTFTGAGALIFQTGSSSSIAERMRIDSSGNVGIGTDSPDIGSVAGTRVLTIASPTAERWGILELAGNRTWGGNQVGEIKFISTDATNNGVLVSLIAINDPSATGTGGSLKFSTRTDGGSLTERMRITSGGSLEVGTATVAAPNAAADNIVIKGEGTAVGLTISNSSNSGTGTIFFGDAASSAAAGFRYNHNTGDMSISAEDNITFTCDNVGIGTTFPDFALDIEAVSSGVQLQIGRTTTNAGSTWMGSDSSGFHLGVGAYGAGNSVSDPNGFTVLTSGNVGVGTASPSKTLQVSSSATGDLMNILCVNTNDTDGDTASIGFSMVDLNYQKAAVIFERTTTQGRGSLHFATNNAAGNNNVSKGDARMTILSGGNVGIGLTDPDNKLHVKGDMVTIEDPSGGFKMELSADADPVTIRSDNLTGAAYGQIAFVAGNGSGSNDQTRMRINSTGKVGIGTTGNFNAGKLVVQNDGRENGGILDIQTGGSNRYYTRVCHNQSSASTAGYWHIKTNIVVNTNVMFLAKFYGYIYGSAQVLDLTHAGYAYSGTNTVINQGTTNNGNNVNASSAIYSSSNGNKVTFRIAFGTGSNFSTYFAGVYMDISFPSPAGAAHDFEIEAQTFNASTNYY